MNTMDISINMSYVVNDRMIQYHHLNTYMHMAIFFTQQGRKVIQSFICFQLNATDFCYVLYHTMVS